MTEQTRDQQLLDEFKEGLEKDGPIVLAQRTAALEEQVAALKAAQAGVDEDMAALRERAEVAERERDDAIERAERADATAKKAKAAVKKADTPAKPRRLGVLADGKSLAGDDLREAIADADDVEIAFSDGTREVAGVAPIAVDGPAWRDHQFGLMLTEPVDIEGTADGVSVSIAGYVLLLDGKPVAYTARSTPLQLAPGQRVRLADDIIF